MCRRRAIAWCLVEIWPTITSNRAIFERKFVTRDCQNSCFQMDLTLDYFTRVLRCCDLGLFAMVHVHRIRIVVKLFPRSMHNRTHTASEHINSHLVRQQRRI